MVVGLIVIATVTVGAKTDIKPELIESSGLLQPSLIGWQLVYILPVAVLTNDLFLANFWMRAFASRTDRDLWIGISLATAVIFVVLLLVGFTGLIAVWSGAFPGDPPQEDGSVSFFLLLEQLPSWVVGIIVVMSVTLSTASFDSIQSAMVSCISNDVFRNRLNIWWVRLMVVLVMIPVVVVAIRAPGILQIYLITDLLSAAVIPVLFLGLSERVFWFVRGFEVVAGGLGGILTVFIFGTIYYGDAQSGGALLLLEAGLYTGDWGAFGAFVAAPIGGILWGAGALALRLGWQWIQARRQGVRFDALDRPDGTVAGRGVYNSGGEDEAESREEIIVNDRVGKFF